MTLARVYLLPRELAFVRSDLVWRWMMLRPANAVELRVRRRNLFRSGILDIEET